MHRSSNRQHSGCPPLYSLSFAESGCLVAAETRPQQKPDEAESSDLLKSDLSGPQFPGSSDRQQNENWGSDTNLQGDLPVLLIGERCVCVLCARLLNTIPWFGETLECFMSGAVCTSWLCCVLWCATVLELGCFVWDWALNVGWCSSGRRDT